MSATEKEKVVSKVKVKKAKAKTKKVFNNSEKLAYRHTRESLSRNPHFILNPNQVGTRVKR